MANLSPGGFVREARTRAGLTQTELARRAGTTQSVISAYESDRRHPALAMLVGLVEAAGSELDIQLRTPGPSLDRLTGPIGSRVRRHRRRLVDAAAVHGLTNLKVFGSVARGQELPESDVDLLADVPPGMGLLALGRAREELESILKTQVDLVPSGSLRPEVVRRVQRDVVSL